MDPLNYLGLAYLVVFLGIALFMFAVSRRQRALEKRVELALSSEKSAGSK